MKRAAVVALAAVVAGGLWLSGSSTFALGTRHNVPEAAQPALLLVLEVASVIGTALWVTAPPGRARLKPACVVLLSSTVAAVGGWQAYGWLGLVAPAAVVLVTDMIAERWSALGTKRDAPRDDERPTEDAAPLPPALEEQGPPAWDGPHAVEVAPDPFWDGPPSRPHPVGAIPEWDAPVTEPDGIPVPGRHRGDHQPAPVVPLQVTGRDGRDDDQRPTDEELVSRALEKWNPIPGIGTVRSGLGVGASRAGRIKQMAEEVRGTSRDGEQGEAAHS